MGIIGIRCGLFVLIEPRWLLDVVWSGRAASAAYDALTYTDTFRQRQGPVLLVLMLLYIPLFVVVIVQGRWSNGMRRIETGLAVATCMAMVWTVVDGPVFMTASSDQMVKVFMTLIVACTVITMAN